MLGPIVLCAAALGSSDTAAVPVLTVGEREYRTWQEFTRSPEFLAQGLRCGTQIAPSVLEAAPGDCSYTRTTPSFEYDPTFVYEISVVFHVIQNTDGTGFVPLSAIQSQIDILNEDFLALPGTNGANGNDAAIQFVLATTDPQGSPTTGVTYSTNDVWFADGGLYYESLAWDTERYLNIYTNNGGGSLGYVPDLPQGNIAGRDFDRIVMLWACVGADAPIGPPFDQGRVGTHEVGHYLGLYHTFWAGCGDPVLCYTTGDTICETEPESGPNNGCIDGPASCATPDPVLNYMNYTDDLCMQEFTPEQVLRMRCSIQFYRPDLPTILGGPEVSTYCTAKTNSLACLPQISAAGTPSETYSGPFEVRGDMFLNNKNGLLFYGFGANSAPFLGGTLCVQPPLRRTAIVNAGGNPPPDDCSGSYLFDMNTLIQSGTDPQLVAGTTFNVQFWARDPADALGVSLSDGLQAKILP